MTDPGYFDNPTEVKTIETAIAAAATSGRFTHLGYSELRSKVVFIINASIKAGLLELYTTADGTVAVQSVPYTDPLQSLKSMAQSIVTQSFKDANAGTAGGKGSGPIRNEDHPEYAGEGV